MWRIANRRASLGFAWFIVAKVLGAQSPIGDPVPVAFGDWHTQTLLANGDLLIVWQESPTFEQPDPLLLRGRRFNIHENQGETMTLVEGTVVVDDIFNQLVAPRADGGFLLTFNRLATDENENPVFLGCHAIPFDGNGRPLAREVIFAPQGGCGEGLVTLADGTFVTAWHRVDDDFGRHPREYRLAGC